MALDVRRGPGAALDDVGVEGPLDEEVGATMLSRDLLEDADELLPDRASLALGVRDARELREEAVLGFHVHERHAEMTTEGLLDLLRLPLSVQPVIDEHAGELIADGAVHEERGDRGVDAPGERAQDLGVADLRADPSDRVLDDVDRGPVGQQAASLVQEPLQDVLTSRRVRHLGMELHREQGALGVLHRRDRDLFRTGGHAEAVRRTCHRVAVTHPDLLFGAEVGEQHSAGLIDRKRRPPVLALARGRHVAAERLRHQLVAVTDAQDGYPHVEQAGVESGRSFLVDGRRSSREDQAGRPALRELGGRDVVGHDLGVDVRLADAPRDQLGVLRSEIDDQDRAGGILFACSWRSGPGRHLSAPSPPAVPPGRSCPRS